MEEKNTEIRETQAPEQNTPVTPNETDKVEMTVKDGSKTSVPKWLIVTVIVMAVVIIGLAVTLVMVLTGGKQEESSQTGSSAVSNISSETVSSDSSDNVDNSNVSADNSQPAVTENGIVLQYSVDNSWGDEGNLNYGVQFGITNNTDSGISGWELVIEVDGLKSCDGWNGTYTQNGNTVTVTNAEYNGDIQTGATVVIGCNLNTDKEIKINKATLNNVDCVVKAGNVNQNNQNNQNNQSGNNGNDSANVDVDALLERSKDAEQGDDWLHTDGNKILDKDGKQVWLTGVNWFGYNTGTNTFDGLWNSELKPSVKAIADHGFNLIRVPMSTELINSWAAGEYPQANYNNACNTIY